MGENNYFNRESGQPQEGQIPEVQYYDENARTPDGSNISRLARVDPELASEMHFQSKERKYRGARD